MGDLNNFTFNNVDVNSYVDKGNNIIDKIGNSLADIVDFFVKMSKTKSFNKIMFYIALIWTFLIIINIIYVYFKYDMEHTPKVKNDNSLSLPEDIDAAKLEYCISGKITEKSFISTLAMLFYKEVLTIEKVLMPGNNEAYKIIRNINKTKEMTNSEEKFLNKLFASFAENGEISFSRIKNVLKNKKDAIALNKLYLDFKLDEYNKIDISSMYEPIDISFSGNIAFTIIGFLILIAGYKFSKLVILFGIIYIINIIYLLRVSKRTQECVNLRAKWLYLKTNIGKISKLPLKELPNAKDWLKYYSYFYILGNQDSFYNDLMKKRPKTVGLEDDDLSDYFDNLKLVGKIIIEFKKVLLVYNEKSK